MTSLPKTWEQALLADLTRINPPNPDRLPNDTDPVSFVPMAAVQEMTGRLDATQAKSWSDVRKGYTRFQDGDVLMAKITPSMENGKAALATALVGGVGAGTTEFHVFRPHSGVDARFILHYLLQETFRRQARARMTGTAGQLRVPTEFLVEQRLPVPPTTEQQRIVEALDSYLSRLDSAVASLQKVQTKLKAYRASVLKAAVEGRLVPTEAEIARREGRDYEPASVLLARILKERRRRWEEAELARMKKAGKTPKDDAWKKKYEEPEAPDTSKLPSLPEGWCWASPSQLSSGDDYSLAIGPFGSNLKTSDYRRLGTPLVFVRNIRGERFDDDEDARYVDAVKAEELRAHRVDAGDILITKMGDPPGDCCIYPRTRPTAIITADCVKVRLGSAWATPSYFLHALRSPLVQQQIHGMTKGVAQKKISLERFRTLAVPVAPEKEQASISDEVERLLSVGMDVLAQTGLGQRRCARLRQSVLKWAFEGKLVDQDPNDEPAEELLARIRAERAAAPMTKTRGRKAKSS